MAAAISIGVIGDYDPEFAPHAATDAALGHAGEALGAEVEVRWHPTASLLGADLDRTLAADGLLCAPGSPYRSLDGALGAVRFARERAVPLLGTCGGFQHVVVEYARNVLGFADAQHAEYDPYASNLFVSELACSLAGQTMAVELAAGSLAAAAYGGTAASERYYCDFGLDPDHRRLLEDGGLRVSGVDADGEVRVLELPGHRFFVATLFVPQASSAPGAPHPLILALLRAAAA